MAYDPRNDGNSPQYQPAGIGRPGDNRGMGQFVAEELPGMIRNRTLAELQELVAGLKANYQAIGLTREQAQQAVTMVEQRIASARPRASVRGPVADTQGYGLRTADVGAVPEAAPLASTASPRPQPDVRMLIEEKTHAYEQGQISYDEWAGFLQQHGITPDQAARDRMGYRTVEPAGERGALPLDTGGGPRVVDPRLAPGEDALSTPAGAVEAPPSTEGALPTDTLPPPRARPRPSGGKARDYDGMTVKKFMEQGDVLHIAINGKGLRNDGGKFVPVGR